MTKRYVITACVVKELPDGSMVTAQVPTFELNANTLGLVNDEHAAKVARSMLQSIAPEGSTVCLDCQEANG